MSNDCTLYIVDFARPKAITITEIKVCSFTETNFQTYSDSGLKTRARTTKITKVLRTEEEAKTFIDSDELKEILISRGNTKKATRYAFDGLQLTVKQAIANWKKRGYECAQENTIRARIAKSAHKPMSLVEAVKIKPFTDSAPNLWKVALNAFPVNTKSICN